MRRLTNTEFITKAILIHGDKYDYSKVEYVNCQTKVCIICPEHGEFWQTPSNHLRNRGCNECGLLQRKRTRDDRSSKLRSHSETKFNTDGTVSIPLPRSGYFLIDAEDYCRVIKHKWRKIKSGYIVSNITLNTNTYLHRYLLEAGVGEVVDHINQIKSDNRRVNLRKCTVGENMRNRLSNRGASKYKGVWWSKQKSKWVSEIRVDNKKFHLGSFSDEEEAARAYDEAAKKYHKDFARLNFPE